MRSWDANAAKAEGKGGTDRGAGPAEGGPVDDCRGVEIIKKKRRGCP